MAVHQTTSDAALKRFTGPSGDKNISEFARQLDGYDAHERVLIKNDPEAGLIAIVAIHDRTLGPALGGTRMWPYTSLSTAMSDALNLSRAMTLKSAITGLPYGGGKAVIIGDPNKLKTEALLSSYGRFLASLDGMFITGEDVGMRLEDIDFVSRFTTNVTGTTKGGSGDPSYMTAKGVLLGMRAAMAHGCGGTNLDSVKVAVQGLGNVGFELCKLLNKLGAALTVTDIDKDKVDRTCETFDAHAVAPDEISSADVDIFAPCALGGVLSSASVPQLSCAIVAGSANNQLADPASAELLMQRGILYCPDYVINAGGLINVAAECEPGGYDRAAVDRRVERIPETLTSIFQRAAREHKSPGLVADTMAKEHLAAAAGKEQRND